MGKAKGGVSRGPGGGKRDRVGDRRRQRTAAALGVSVEDKGHLDAMHERALERFGVGVGVIVQEEARLEREAISHKAQRDRLPWRRRLWFPFGEFHRLRRMQGEAAARSEEWGRRLKTVALDVAGQRDESVDHAVVRGAGGR